ncbi:hypothetical protein Q7P35_002331 [Cladosporium inversicolor]
MGLATLEDWAKPKRERLMALNHICAFDALVTLLDGSVAPFDAADTITESYRNYVEQPLKNSENDRVQRFWRILCDAARTFVSAQSRLVDVLHEVSTQPDVIAVDELLSKDSKGMIYWRDLPGFPFALCDDALRLFPLHHRPASAKDNIIDYHHPYDHSPEEINEFLEQAPYLLNGTRFAATLFEQGFDAPRLDLAAQADHLLEDGIESPHNDEHPVKSRAWKVLLPMSATWFIIAGKTIYKMCLDDQESQNLHSNRVWNKPKWELWKEQLRKFENRNNFDEECRGYATRALAKMVEVANAL